MKVTAQDLLQLPKVLVLFKLIFDNSHFLQLYIFNSFFNYQGGFTLEGLINNISVGIQFIECWLKGNPESSFNLKLLSVTSRQLPKDL